AHDEVVVGVGGDLREVGDDDDLAGAGEGREAGPDVQGRTSTDAGVDLVEDEGGHLAASGAGHRDLDGEHDPAQLTAGGRLGDGAGLRALVRRSPDLDAVAAVGADPAGAAFAPGVGELLTAVLAAWSDDDLDHGAGHAEAGELLPHDPGEFLGRSLPGRRQLL